MATKIFTSEGLESFKKDLELVNVIFIGVYQLIDNYVLLQKELADKEQEIKDLNKVSKVKQLDKLVNELQNEYSIVLFNSGESGSGKSMSLFGNYDKKGILYTEFKNLYNLPNFKKITLEYLFEEYYNPIDFDLINNK